MGFLAPCIPGNVSLKFSLRYVQHEPNRRPNRRILVSEACKGAKTDFAVTRCHFERFTSLRCQNDRTKLLNSESECQGSWETWRSFSFVVGLSDFEIYVAAKMTAKCPMNLDTQNPSSLYHCDHFDTPVM